MAGLSRPQRTDYINVISSSFRFCNVQYGSAKCWSHRCNLVYCKQFKFYVQYCSVLYTLELHGEVITVLHIDVQHCTPVYSMHCKL
jgi:hypothetical protein